MDTVVELDAGRMAAFGEKMLGILNGGMASYMISIGHRVGLFDTMAGMRAPATSAEIARAAGLNERYVREWLGAMATSGIVEYASGRDAYALPPEHAAMTTRAAGPNNFASFAQLVPLCASIEDELIDKFRQGGGVPYSSYPRFHATMAEISGVTFDAALVDVTLPLVPGAIERLQAGIRVADVGCGSGHAVNVMAKAFPNSTFVGMDFSDAALAVGRAEAEAWGLANASFRAQDAAKLSGDEIFDLMTTFDAVHDQADPHAMVNGIYRSLVPGGSWLCVEHPGVESRRREHRPSARSVHVRGVVLALHDRVARVRRRRARCHVGRAEGPRGVHGRRLRRDRRAQHSGRRVQQLLRVSKGRVTRSRGGSASSVTMC